MKKITLSIFLFFISILGFSQVSIGAGNNEAQSVPFDPYFGYSYTQSIYLASEINASGNINSLQWYFSGTSLLPNCQDITIYLGHSTKTVFAGNTDWEPVTNLTASYTGTIPVTGAGWVTITLDTPFAYNGTDNLIIAVDENMASYDSSSDDFYNSAVTGSRSIYYANDNTNPDPATPPSGTRVSYVPNVVLGGIVQACPSPTTLTVDNITDVTADLHWVEIGSTFDWEYVVQAPGTGVPTVNGTPADANDPYSIGGLTANTTYEVYVRSVCSFTEKSSWLGPVNFTTECATYSVPALESFTTYVPGCWEEADNGDLTAGPATYGSSSWISDGFGNNGTTGSARYEIWLATANDWLITPTFAIPVTGYELKFDAAATQYNTTAAPTTPWEADDYVEVLISTTGTTNWTVLYTYNDTNVPAPAGTPNVIDLDAYAGQNVKFAFRVVEGAANGSADINFYIDNFEIRLTPSTPPVCATNVVATPDASCGNFATGISWDAVSGADGYRITMGTTTGGNDVLDNVDLGTALSYSHLGLVNTNYFVTIYPYNANGNAVGCTEITYMTNATGCYCLSTPTSVDGVGITNVQIVATDFANTVSTSPVYNDHTATAVDMSQGINNNVQISFDTGFGYDYSVVIWIDANDDFTFESSEIVYTGLSVDDPTTILNASFILPGTTSLGQHRMRIVATDVVQSPSNPCYSGTYGETADFTINVIAATCAPVTLASTNIVSDCANSQFSVELDVTTLGDGTPTVSDGVTTWDITATGINTVGPFINGASVNLTIYHGSDVTCDLPLGTFTYTCPPANDECANAVSLTVNSNYSCGSVTSGTVLAATASSVDATACFGTENDDVWYSFVATQATHRIQLTNIAGSTTDMYHSLWTGPDCNTLTLVAGSCSDPNTSNPTGLSIGQTYYVRVNSYTSSAGQTSTFDICVGTDPALGSSAFDLSGFSAYPNPVKDILNLEYTSGITSVKVFNLLGQEVLSKTLNAASAKVDMSQLNSGAYIVNVEIEGAMQTIKIIKE
ncbi:GEVED domain-containing protein [Flavobacterium sp.]|uniref:GEVED domain-containing protein n=1 Tax=Flavobacterium sp. TaxID=239 RepID=UPI004048C8A2